MVGVPVELLWLLSLDFNMGEKKKIKKKKKRKAQRREETERRNRKFWRPYNPWGEFP